MMSSSSRDPFTSKENAPAAAPVRNAGPMKPPGQDSGSKVPLGGAMSSSTGAGSGQKIDKSSFPKGDLFFFGVFLTQIESGPQPCRVKVPAGATI